MEGHRRSRRRQVRLRASSVGAQKVQAALCPSPCVRAHAVPCIQEDDSLCSTRDSADYGELCASDVSFLWLRSESIRIHRTADATRNRWVALLGKYPNLKNDHVYEEKMSSRSRHNRGMQWADFRERVEVFRGALARRDRFMDCTAPTGESDAQKHADSASSAHLVGATDQTCCAQLARNQMRQARSLCLLIQPQCMLRIGRPPLRAVRTQRPTTRRCRAGESQSPHSQRSHSETPQLTPLSMVMRRRELDIDLNAPPPPDNGQQDGDFHVHNGHPRRGSPEHEGGDSFGEDGMPRRKIQTRFSKRKVSPQGHGRVAPDTVAAQNERSPSSGCDILS